MEDKCNELTRMCEYYETMIATERNEKTLVFAQLQAVESAHAKVRYIVDIVIGKRIESRWW